MVRAKEQETVEKVLASIGRFRLAVLNSGVVGLEDLTAYEREVLNTALETLVAAPLREIVPRD